ncbi:MAG: DUF1127 domain-containing protein [Pseudomonadota bacterium]
MAFLTHSEPQPLGLSKIVAAPFRAFWDMLIATAEASRISKEAEFLLSLSDEELAAQGLNREDLPRYLMRNFVHI